MVSRSTRRSCLQCCVSRRTAEKPYLAVSRISMSGHGIETLSIPTWPKSVHRRGHSVLDNQDRNRAKQDSENVATLPNGASSRRPSFVLSLCSADERKDRKRTRLNSI